MRYLLVAYSFFLGLSGFSQKTVDVTNGDVNLGSNPLHIVSGTPFINYKFVRLVDGTPYFSEEWMKGLVVGKDGHEYKNLEIRMDLFDNKIHFRDETSNELVCTTPLKEVVLSDKDGNNFRFIHSSELPIPSSAPKNSWYLWLLSGPASLYKSFDKKLYEETPYNSATTEQHIKTFEKFLVLYNNHLLEIKKIKDAPDVLANKKNELEEFLRNKDEKNSSMEDRYTALVNYYNSLLKDQK